jgi:hypothetical protein
MTRRRGTQTATIRLVALAALALAACDNTAGPAIDQGGDRPRIDAPRADRSPDLSADLWSVDRAAADRARTDARPHDLAAEARFDGGVPFKDFVFDQILVPTNQVDAMKVGLQYNGKTYNALGQVLALVASQMPGLMIQRGMDLAVYQGNVLELLRVQAASFSSGPALAKMWRGQAQACCTAYTNLALCKTQATTNCFNGTHSFAPDPVSPSPTQSTGSIVSSQLSLGPAALKLDLPLTGQSMIMTLDNGQLKGSLGAAGITDGIIAGAVPVQEVSTLIIPGLADVLDLLLKDPLTDAATKAALSTLFDTNKDGSITATELAGNALISTVLAGDLDLDGDKKIDHLSIGLGFTAVGAVIAP